MTRTRCKHLTPSQMPRAHGRARACYLIFVKLPKGDCLQMELISSALTWLRGLQSRPLSHHYRAGRHPVILAPFLVQVIPSKDHVVCIQQEPAPDMPALFIAGLLTDLTFLSWGLILSFQVFPALNVYLSSPSDLSLEDTFVFFDPVLSDPPP